jgi:hypothetical protein
MSVLTASPCLSPLPLDAMVSVYVITQLFEVRLSNASIRRRSCEDGIGASEGVGKQADRSQESIEQQTRHGFAMKSVWVQGG